MKRVGNLFEKVVEPENLRLAFWKAGPMRAGSTPSTPRRSAARSIMSNLLPLRQE